MQRTGGRQPPPPPLRFSLDAKSDKRSADAISTRLVQPSRSAFIFRNQEYRGRGENPTAEISIEEIRNSSERTSAER